MVVDRISLIIFSSRLCFLQIVLMMLIRSLVGMFVYMLEISSDANFSSGKKGICEISFISWIEFLTLYTVGIGRCVFKMSVSILASLYDGTFLKLTTGRMGVPSLCIFINPLKSEAIIRQWNSQMNIR